MRFLITGITGFVGPHLTRHLLKEGHEVYGTHCHEILEKIEDVKYLYADVKNFSDINNLFREHRFNGVFHLASLTHPPTSFEQPELYFHTNAVGTIYVCEAIRSYQPECVLMNCSTSEVYGINPESAIITERARLKPSNPYAVSKAAADMYCSERFKNGFLKGFTTRAFSHTGPGRPSNYSISSDAIQIARIIKGKQEPVIKVGNLDCKRVVMDVRDVVDVYYRLMIQHINMPGFVRDLPQGEIYNICGDELCRIGYFLDLMIEMYDLKVTTEIDDKLFRKIDIPVQYPSSAKVRELLSWKPSIPIETTLRDLVEYWLERV